MRCLLILLFVAFGGMTAKADTIIVTGLLLDTNGTRAGGYTVKIYAGRPGVGDAADTTSSNGIYTVVKENVDPNTLNLWYVVCDQNKRKAISKLDFVRRPNNIWQAKVQDLPLLHTDQISYSTNEASEIIGVIADIEAIKVKSGELTESAANERLSSEAATVLGRTDLGMDPTSAIRSINNTVKSKANANLPTLPLFQGDTFVNLRNRPEFNPKSRARLEPRCEKDEGASRVTPRDTD